jgi:hypothetical protein
MAEHCPIHGMDESECHELHRDLLKEVSEYISKHPGDDGANICDALEADAFACTSAIQQLQADGCIRFDRNAGGFVVAD